MRPTGLDFFPDGRLALCTLGGDVWIASGLDEKLEHVTWRRFAAGLREPMGLRIVGGKIHVGCRDQITRLHDLNGDGEADFYERLNAGRTLVPNFHAFAYDLQTDRAGNFYYGTGGNQLGENEPWHGKLFRVSPDGAKLEAVASGFRAPNGLTIGPDDAIYVAENQGQWIPSSKISRVKPGGFYGFVADPKAAPTAKAPPSFDPPVCYLPMTWDNSSGGGAFCESEKWGPFRGKMLHTSFGSAALFAISEQRVGEVSNGAVMKFPLQAFESGIERARFAPHDGQLYVCGLKGWQSRAIRDGCLARVRYTGKPVTMPTGWRVEKDAVVIDFATPLDPASAADEQNYAAEQWNYLWHSTYGSPDVSVTDPKKRGRDRVDIRAAKLSADHLHVTLEIPGLVPVMQMLVKMNIKTAAGAPLETEIASTINVVPQ
jgi:glucose/arabinose dehydrogenase